MGDGAASGSKQHRPGTTARERAASAQQGVAIPSQGRWWGICGRDRDQQSAQLLDVHLPARLALRLWHALKADWREYAERTGFRLERPPRWLDGERFDRALAAVKGQQESWSCDQVDPRSGEVLTAADFGKGGDRVNRLGLTLPGGTIDTDLRSSQPAKILDAHRHK